MLDLTATPLISALNTFAPEGVWVLTLLVCFTGIVLMHRFFGVAGLYAYIAVGVIGANIQVLKVVQFSVFSDPVALGTILFSSTYLATDMLAEFHGAKAARRGVFIGFATLLMFTVLMVLTLGFRPLTQAEAGADMAWALGVQDNMAALFTPIPALFLAGMCAYLISQFHDVWLYQVLHRITGGRFLWLRNNASTMVSGLIDNTVFSILAWVVFAATPMAWEPLIFTYILGTYVLRLVVAALDTPFLYLARRIGAPATPAYA